MGKPGYRDPDQMLRDLDQARIAALETALRAALTVMREWINRAEFNGGTVDIEDIAGAKKLYATMVWAYTGKRQQQQEGGAGGDFAR